MHDMMPWRVLYVDDDPQMLAQVQEYLADDEVVLASKQVQVQTEDDFSEALTWLEKQRFDIVVLDVRLGSWSAEPNSEAGRQTLGEIRGRRFVPVVFYTGLPRIVADLESSLVRVVEKTEGPDGLLRALNELIATGLPNVNRALLKYVEVVQGRYMWDFVAKEWASFGERPDPFDLAFLLARRLAVALSGPGIDDLAADLSDEPAIEGKPSQDTVHPMRYYLIPPVDAVPGVGDLYELTENNTTERWILLTPSCDLHNDKAEYVLLARCLPLVEQKEYVEWVEVASKQHEGRLRELLKNNRKVGQRERYHFLPGVFSLANSVVDFQQLMSVECTKLETDKWKRVASLDSPYAEVLLGRFTRYFGRLGTPDLDLDIVLGRLH